MTLPAGWVPSDTGEVAERFGVSRETAEALECFAALLSRWTRTVNLISAGSIPDLWSRHILDSAQLFGAVQSPPRHWVDLGSGGGLPAIVCALLACDAGWTTQFTLLESDQRKCAFLTTALRDLSLSARVLPNRLEAAAPQNADLLTARALAPLDVLLDWSLRHANEQATYLFPKGARFQEEISDAERRWTFTLDTLPSITDPAARLLRLRDLAKR
ncbi:MAG: 16S rRNA (guanine(527)-N(7))-methyltransferase RsmG [Pseudomonadota bacterium]